MAYKVTIEYEDGMTVKATAATWEAACERVEEDVRNGAKATIQAFDEYEQNAYDYERSKELNREVFVTVEPGCISMNREQQYVDQTIHAYRSGTLEPNMVITKLTDTEIHITFKR